MDDYKEIFKRELDRLTYMYIKANTISKKKRMAYDLIFFEDMYNSFSEEKVEFPWTYDEDLIDVRLELVDEFIRNVLENQSMLLKISENNFNIFLEEDFSVHKYYGKYYHKINEELIQKYMVMFYRNMDKNLVSRFRNKLENLELFVNNNMEVYDGLTFPIESIDKNVIFFRTGENMCIDDARILVHEMGHDFEFNNASKFGITSTWNKIAKTVYVEVSSSFFEYAFINYLIDNKIYLYDAMMLKERYLKQVFYFLSYIMIIFKMQRLNMDYDFSVKLNSEDVVNYANELLVKMNSCDGEYELDEKINFRHSFIYGIGKLLSIYVYESYKNNPKEFLSNFRKVLLEYKDTGIKAFEYIGITEEDLVNGDVLRRVLKEIK